MNDGKSNLVSGIASGRRVCRWVDIGEDGRRSTSAGVSPEWRSSFLEQVSPVKRSLTISEGGFECRVFEARARPGLFLSQCRDRIDSRGTKGSAQQLPYDVFQIHAAKLSDIQYVRGHEELTSLAK